MPSAPTASSDQPGRSCRQGPYCKAHSRRAKGLQTMHNRSPPGHHVVGTAKRRACRVCRIENRVRATNKDRTLASEAHSAQGRPQRGSRSRRKKVHLATWLANSACRLTHSPWRADRGRHSSQSRASRARRATRCRSRVGGSLVSQGARLVIALLSHRSRAFRIWTRSLDGMPMRRETARGVRSPRKVPGHGHQWLMWKHSRHQQSRAPPKAPQTAHDRPDTSFARKHCSLLKVETAFSGQMRDRQGGCSHHHWTRGRQVSARTTCIRGTALGKMA
mmetsp:Transcript_5111/g.14684  ORF Transcript_5111/g.14684 Transcript_5111/m.14684 type:complete len:276 (-) Transcript_5111:355-1182(-)